eukprot:c19028_g2_i1 orf=233-1582(-)
MEAADSIGNESHEGQISANVKRKSRRSNSKGSCSSQEKNGYAGKAFGSKQRQTNIQKQPRKRAQSCAQVRRGVPHAPPALQDAMLAVRPPVRIQDIAPSDDYQYVPGLDDDLALLCLAFLPRSEHGKCMQLNRKFCSLITSGYLFKIRRILGITEQWIYMFLSGQRVWQSYDPKARRWSSLPPFAADYCFQSSDKESFTVGTQLLVVGRSADDGLVSWRYDLVRNEWDRGSTMLTPRCLYAWASCGTYAYVAGGLTLANEVLQSAERYDPETETWEALPPMHECRKRCSGCLLDGKFYVLGGENDVAGALTSCEVYDCATKTWTLLPNMLPWGDARPFAGAPPLSAVVSNELYLLEPESHQLKVFIKSTHSWKALGEVPVRTDLVNGWGVAFKSLGEYLLLIGGGRSSAYPDGMYVCRPDPVNGSLEWILLSRLCPFEQFVLNCAIVSA